MAGEVLVGGTAYEITKGKTLIGGTAYNISKGRTLIGGTDYGITFLPKFSELFESIDTFDRWGQNATSLGTYPGNSQSTYPEPDSSLPQPQVGDIWYLFYAVGESLEISKIELLTSTTMSKTVLKTFAVGTQYSTTINSNNTGIYGSSTTAAANFIYLHFTLDSKIVDKMLTQGTITVVKGYHSTSTTSTTANLGISSSTSLSKGILFPVFSNLNGQSTSSTKTTLWGAIDATTPTGNIIVGGTNATFISTARPLLITSSSYYMPSYNGTAVVQYVRGYSLIYFEENW